MTQEALKLALEALERSVATCFDQYAHQQVLSQPDHFINQAITAIKEALAQTQEPIICKANQQCLSGFPCVCVAPAPQRTWVGLSEDDKVLINHDANFNQFMTAGEYADRVQQLTKARLKDKNT